VVGVQTESSLRGKVALVTGGSRGIGLATALALVDHGATVVTVSASAVAADGIDERIDRHLVVDVSDFPAMETAVAEVLDRHQRIDVLINNAGVRGVRGPITDLRSQDYLRTLQVNLLGPFHGMKLVLPNMLERGEGVIVNTSSGAGSRPRPQRSMYGSSKAALDHLSISVANEVAPLGVRVYSFHPGPTDTVLFNGARYDAATPADIEALDARFAAGEVQAPSELGEAIAWLATPSGAAFPEVIVPWSKPDKRAEIRAIAGLVAPTRVVQEGNPS
jgi:NAD(P)-dependent dehydrogenase (short-subunit alcohol dehydrogenase family)